MIPAVKIQEDADPTLTRDGSIAENEEGDHLIRAFIGRSDGPTLIVVGSLHGNEPAGARALHELASELSPHEADLSGRVYFVTGNTRALKKGVRYVDSDLNRFWTAKNLSNVSCPSLIELAEGRELTELDQLFDSILITAMDEVFVLDLHSTSAEGMPFATVGDTLRNREFAGKFPVAILLGIEEQLDGTLLEYLNNAGAVTLGFEGGQHFSQETIENHKAMVRIALSAAGLVSDKCGLDIDRSTRRLSATSRGGGIFEVRYRHAISEKDGFQMKPGFQNFDPVRKGSVLGRDTRGEVVANETGVVLMPLYQKLGEDGFFLGRRISPFWLWLSARLRRIGLQKVIHLLPGVSCDPDDPATLIINTRIARLFPLQIFHLLGFRRRRWIDNKLVVSRRKHDTTGPFRWKGDPADSGPT